MGWGWAWGGARTAGVACASADCRCSVCACVLAGAVPLTLAQRLDELVSLVETLFRKLVMILHHEWARRGR
jgi:hypothetical protein